MDQHQRPVGPVNLPLGVVSGQVEGVNLIPRPVVGDPLRVAERPEPRRRLRCMASDVCLLHWLAVCCQVYTIVALMNSCTISFLIVT